MQLYTYKKRQGTTERLKKTQYAHTYMCVQLSEGLQHDMVNFRCTLHAVAMATCIIASLRRSEAKSLSLAESGRGVNHHLQTHTDKDTWRHEATPATD